MKIFNDQGCLNRMHASPDFPALAGMFVRSGLPQNIAMAASAIPRFLRDRAVVVQPGSIIKWLSYRRPMFFMVQDE